MINGVEYLRKHYCSHCPIKSPRSTGVKLLEHVWRKEWRRVVDYGCNNWRNSRYLAEKFSVDMIRIDILPLSDPDVVAHPAFLPFRDNAADIFLLTHILMFVPKTLWRRVAEELRRVAKVAVVEVYHVKHTYAERFNNEEILALFPTVVRRNVRRDMVNLVVEMS